jgi:serine/threonine-protein kinase
MASQEQEVPSFLLAQLGLAADGILDQRYRILRLLGQGGMGAVYYAEHVGLKRPVAVKVLHAESANREEAVRRFQREAQVAATLRHPNIVEVFDVGVAQSGEPYLVMEYLEGESLQALMVRHPRTDLATACAVMEPVLLALQAAHRREIVHRDLKPDNVFLAAQPDGRVAIKIIDFGISKIVNGEPDRWRTQTGAVLGTPNYMSPEQARGAAGVDHRADLYAVGAILYEMLTGGLPYTGDSFAELYARLLTEPPRPPRSVYPQLATEIEPLLKKAVGKDPAERFQSAGEMLAALVAFPAFARRSERLSALASGQAMVTFAVGDLGAPAQVKSMEQASAAELAHSISAPSSGSGWTGGSAVVARDAETSSSSSSSSSSLSLSSSKRSWLLLAVGALIVALAVTVGVLLVNGPPARPAPASVVAVPSVSSPPSRPAAAQPVAAEPAPVQPAPAQPAVAQPEAVQPATADDRAAPPPAKTARHKAAAAAELAPAESTTSKSGSSGGLGNSLRALGTDIVSKARSQIKRIPDPRSKSE